MTHRISPQPFDRFLESVAEAEFDTFRYVPGAAVESAAAFAEMRSYLLDLYEGATAEASRVGHDGQIIDCIPEDRHPAARRSNSDVTAKPPPDQPVPESYETASPSFITPATREVAGMLPANQYQDVTEAGEEYPVGTLPMYRTTLAQLSRFRNLAAFAAKDRFAGAPASGIPPKRYATGEQDVDCLGGTSYLNVWSPFAAASFQGTFSQQWYSGVSDGTWIQTVECGWHVDIARYGDAQPHLFVFTTLRNYDDGQNFYNQDGGVFRPAPNPYVLPGTPLLFSQTDGTQVAYRMGFYLTAGAWWFYFNDRPIGCYPLALFGDGPLARGAQRIKFGGEVENRLAIGWPAMGSGAFAAAGYGKAAYHRQALAYPTGGSAANANLTEAGSITGPCYTINITNNSTTDWGTYLYLGGPGGLTC